MKSNRVCALPPWIGRGEHEVPCAPLLGIAIAPMADACGNVKGSITDITAERHPIAPTTYPSQQNWGNEFRHSELRILIELDLGNGWAR
jgi:hypothetical protein